MLKSIITKKGILSLLIVLGSISSTMAAEVIRLIVKEDRAACTGVGPMNCLQVKYKNSKNWEFFYSEIQGFKHQEGYRYTLSVIRTKRKNVPADASIYTYKLKKVIKKEKIAVANLSKSDLTAVAGQKWSLVRMNGKEVGISKIHLTLDAKGNKFSGSAGCNTIFGGFSYDQKNREIKMGNVASTLMACSDDKVMKLEYEYTQALNDKRFRVAHTANTMTFYKGDESVLEFSNGKGGTEEGGNDIWKFIASYKWRLIQMNGETQTESPVTINFSPAEQRFSGNSGCNNYFGTYQSGKETITFGPAASTRRACLDQNLSALESKFLGMLGTKEFRFDVADQTLNLYQNDRLVLMFGLTK
ncbi:META domain-containing protein [Pedobacter caeni]|uniref:META domain-containing protein n=1 Tax=Pedobacter caeni TaxID=288992 RepID=A0A1M5HQ52_9SPHI|nr:META domain-containing protein [Pedobacter caeni]SHG18065.1 META domain-containing protein [Pedobacter caeni]